MAGYSEPALGGETLRLARTGDQILVQGSDVKKVLGGGLVADAWSLRSPEAGVLIGRSLDDKGQPLPNLVMLCREDRWDAPALPAPPSGQVTAITCLASDWHYRVYVPTSYDPAVPAPLVVHADPGGNAKPLSTALADEYGWVSIGLTESRNGDYRPVIIDRDAALFDVRQRLNIDWRRVIFAGDSGGARASSVAANSHPGICAGLLLSVAAYENATPHPRIPIFFITGDGDSNLAEVLAAHAQAKAAKRPTELLRDGRGHVNAGPADFDRALRWLHDHLVPYGPAAPAGKAPKRS